MLRKVNLAEQFGRISEHWKPRVGAELNGQQVKLVKFDGAFDWHHHEQEDELFLVVEGEFRMEYRDSAGAQVESLLLRAGEFLMVPRGTEHRPVADSEVQVLLFEPATTLNTGNLRNRRTVEQLETV